MVLVLRAWLLAMLASSALMAQSGEKIFTVRDSAGIRIVAHRSLSKAPIAFRVDRFPFIAIGGLSENVDEELDSNHPYLSAIELNNGLIVVNDAARLHYFDRSGRLIRIVGSRGSGPGEFERTGFVCRLHGDTVLVVDAGSGRVSLWGPNGDYIRSVARPGYVPSMGCWPDGSLLVREVGHAQRGASGMLSFSYVRQQLDGSRALSYGRFMADRYAGQLMYETRLVPRGDDLIVGEAERFEIRRHRPDGTLVVVSRVAEDPSAVSDSEWLRMTEDLMPTNLLGAARRQERARLLAQPKPRTYPAHARIHVDPLYRVWVEDYQQRHIHYVLDSTGILLGRVDVSSAVPTAGRVTLVGVGASHIVVRWSDADGAARLSFHRLHSMPARP